MVVHSLDTADNAEKIKIKVSEDMQQVGILLRRSHILLCNANSCSCSDVIVVVVLG